MVDLLEPSVVFVQDAAQYARALAAVRELVPGITVIAVEQAQAVAGAVPWAQVVATPVTSAVADSLAAITPETVAKYQFTSGSTGVPKAVIVTQRMLCSAAMMAAQMVQWPQGEAPETVLLDWLPWSHVAGGHGVFNAVLMEGGTLHIDEGRPTPAEFGATLRNLYEVSPVRFSGVPVAYALLAEALERDEALGRSFFRNLRRMTYSGSRLPDAVHDTIQAQAVRHTGHRIPFVSAYGSTETSAAVTYVYWPSERTGLVGLPHPGVAMKLVPLDDGARYEIRVKSVAVTPGYLKQPAVTAESFDDEGYLRMGDAATFVDPDDPHEGLAFAGRVAEEFKLQSGVFVRVGTLRVECINATSPLLRDLVITGADQAWVGALAWLNLQACRELVGLPQADFATLAAHPTLRQALQDGLRSHNQRHPASSMRVRRLWLLEQPPSMDAGETNDKGYINQRKVLETRQDAVQALYAGQATVSLVEID
jgi:feruloyl-CoA synthase